MAEDGCRLLLEHKCSDSATDLGQQMLELYTDAKIEESEESLGESACHEGSSHRRHGGYCVDLHPLWSSYRVGIVAIYLKQLMDASGASQRHVGRPARLHEGLGLRKEPGMSPVPPRLHQRRRVHGLAGKGLRL